MSRLSGLCGKVLRCHGQGRKGPLACWTGYLWTVLRSWCLCCWRDSFSVCSTSSSSSSVMAGTLAMSFMRHPVLAYRKWLMTSRRPLYSFRQARHWLVAANFCTMFTVLCAWYACEHRALNDAKLAWHCSHTNCWAACTGRLGVFQATLNSSQSWCISAWKVRN